MWTVGGLVERGNQIPILLHRLYLIKVSMKGWKGSKILKNLSTWFMDDPILKNRFTYWKTTIYEVTFEYFSRLNKREKVFSF